MIKLAVVPILLLTAVAIHADEIILFPLDYGTTAGAHGSRWEVEWLWRNSGPGVVAWSALPGAIPEPILIEPGLTQLWRSQEPGGLPLLFSFFGATEQMKYSIIVRDVTRDSETWGAEIPVVRQRDFKTDRIELLSVPTSVRFRRNLRLYQIGEQSALRVRIWDAEAELSPPFSTRLLVEKTYHLDRSNWHLMVSDLDREFPQMLATPRVRIEIERTEGPSIFWGFITVTNNETQHVTTISPQ